MITTALAQLAQEISTQRGVLTTGIAEIQELFYGENGYEYSVMMDSPDGREQVHWVFRNSPSKTYQQPVTNGTWPGYLFGRNDWVVKWWQRGYQEDAIAAQKSLREGKEATSGLQSMTSEDLDALIDLPDILDKNTTALRAARKYFREGKNEMLARKQSVVNSEWDERRLECLHDVHRGAG